MLALSNSRRRTRANNFEPDYMRTLNESDEGENDTDTIGAEEWNAQKAAMEKQIQQLCSALHNAEKKAADAAKQLEQQKAAAEAEHRELADLREIVFNRDEIESSADDSTEVIDSKIYPYTVQKSTVVFGGHETWVKALKPLLKGDIKFIAREMKIDMLLPHIISKLRKPDRWGCSSNTLENICLI